MAHGKKIVFFLFCVLGIYFVFKTNFKKLELDIDSTKPIRTSLVNKPINKNIKKGNQVNSEPLPHFEVQKLEEEKNNSPVAMPNKRIAAPIKVNPPNNAIKPQNSIHFQIEDGLVVVQGDLVLGAPVNNNIPNEGQIEIPMLRLWEGGEIPFSISSDLVNSKRVLDALQLFKNTPIQFIPIDTQQDGIVFVEGKLTCKSYLGRMGGLQPLWVAPDCSPADIAHEIMHALGFVHEQNRSDRDIYININWSNIQTQYIHNFELLPSSLMEVSGSGPFDYQSIMMYPEKAFAINSEIKTITSKTNKLIYPLKNLSRIDIERLHKLYSR